MDINFLNQADSVALQFERARRALEAAKTELEGAKKAYDDVLAQADEHGIPKAKLKKLTEDRVAQLLESGLVDFGPAASARPKSDKAKPKADKSKAKKAKDDDGTVDPAEAWAAKPEPHEIEPDNEHEDEHEAST